MYVTSLLIQWTTGSFTQPVIVPVPPGVGRGRGGGKRRRILPDGRIIYATDMEMVAILRAYRQHKAIQAKEISDAAQASRELFVKPSKTTFVLPEVVFEDTDRLKQIEEELILLIHESTRRSN